MVVVVAGRNVVDGAAVLVDLDVVVVVAMIVVVDGHVVPTVEAVVEDDFDVEAVVEDRLEDVVGDVDGETGSVVTVDETGSDVVVDV